MTTCPETVFPVQRSWGPELVYTNTCWYNVTRRTRDCIWDPWKVAYQFNSCTINLPTARFAVLAMLSTSSVLVLKVSLPNCFSIHGHICILQYDMFDINCKWAYNPCHEFVNAFNISTDVLYMYTHIYIYILCNTNKCI